MPLHLLSKKSWNVYNTENIARVRRDEADARAQEADTERRQRAEDGETRLAQLRGQEPADPLAPSSVPTDTGQGSHSHSRKKRRLVGEDDTEREIRLATPHGSKKHRTEESITDANGHIDLVQRQPADANGSKTRSGDIAGEIGIRLADAAGRHSQAGKPWYNTAAAEGYVYHEVGKDVWGKEDAGREHRDRKRMDANDPLAAMKKGVKQLRQAEAQRREWREQRERDLVEVEELARRERKRQRRRHHDEESLDGFDLDAGFVEKRDGGKTDKSHHTERHRNSHHHRRRLRSRSPYRRKERRRSRDATASSTR